MDNNNNNNIENVTEKYEQGTISHETDSDNVQSDPTLTFEATKAQVTTNKNTGIKIFFSIIAVMMAIVIAVAAGFVFGKSSVTNSLNFTDGNTLESKEDAVKRSNYTEVFNNCKASVVCINVYNEDDEGTGYASGVIYSSDGYIVTNDHLYSSIKSPKFIVTLADGTEHSAEFVAGDTRSDLAVLKINATGLSAASFGNYNEVVVGEEVIAIGYPFGAIEGSILTVGTISTKATRVRTTSSYAVKMIQTDTAINPGSSGGALINMYSQVIGITSAKLVGTVYDSVGYAIPSSTVVKIVDSLIRNGYVADRGKLGITYTAIDTIASVKRGIPKGLEIAEVTSDSDLYGKNLKKGDIITHINDIAIENSNIALDIIESTPHGQSMSFTVYRPSTKVTETIYASLIPDPGTSGYINEVLPELDSSEPSDNIFDILPNH